MSWEDEYWSQYEWSVDCRTGETRRRSAPIPTPQDRREDLPTREEAEAER